MPRDMLRFSLAVLTLVLGLAAVRADDWPGWRGLQGDGSSAETGVPVRWSATDNVAWKVPVPYGGHSSPIVYEDLVILVGCDAAAQTRVLWALDRRTGKTLWETTVAQAPLERIHKLNSHASSTPAIDADRIYVSFLDEKDMLIAAYNHAGQELWKVEPGIFSSVHGYCSSPVLYKDKVIINGDHDGEAYLVALDRATGKTLWKTPRENKTRSYCTPIIREIAGRTQLMLSGSKCIASYDPDTGKRQWIIDGPTEQFVASPLYHDGLLFITGGFPDKHILTIDPTGQDNVTATHIRWRHLNKGVSYVPSPVACDHYFLVAADNGIASCYAAKTGDLQWQERLGRHYSASLVTAGGLVYFLDDDGVTKVVKPGPQLEVVAENPLGDGCYASPAISQGQFFIRTEATLFCLGK